MSLHYCDLDATTRLLMLEELAADAASGLLYICKRLTEAGETDWPELLRRAIETGDDTTLAAELQQRCLLEAYEVRYRSGRPCRAKVPRTAAELLAEGEFNRYYCRAICRRSLDEGQGLVEVYRAKLVHEPRLRSTCLVGAQIDAQRLLDDLRAHAGGIDTGELGVPAGPNSGLSIRLTS